MQYKKDKTELAGYSNNKSWPDWAAEFNRKLLSGKMKSPNQQKKTKGKYWPKHVFKETDFKHLCLNSLPELSLVWEEPLMSVGFRMSLTLWEHCDYSMYLPLQAYICHVSFKPSKPKIHLMDSEGREAVRRRVGRSWDKQPEKLLLLEDALVE